MSGRQLRVHCKSIRGKTKEELTKQLDTLKQELASLRVAQVTGGVPSKLSKMWVTSTHHKNLLNNIINIYLTFSLLYMMTLLKNINLIFSLLWHCLIICI